MTLDHENLEKKIKSTFSACSSTLPPFGHPACSFLITLVGGCGSPRRWSAWDFQLIGTSKKIWVNSTNVQRTMEKMTEHMVFLATWNILRIGKLQQKKLGGRTWLRTVRVSRYRNMIISETFHRFFLISGLRIQKQKMHRSLVTRKQMSSLGGTHFIWTSTQFFEALPPGSASQCTQASPSWRRKT